MGWMVGDDDDKLWDVDCHVRIVIVVGATLCALLIIEFIIVSVPDCRTPVPVPVPVVLAV